MIISGGELRGRRFSAPRGERTRPTPGRVKEALFSILATKLEGAHVLDLYAGTGALGFEAVSRGAASCTFVEIHRATADALRDTAKAFGVAERCRVVIGAAERAIARLGQGATLIFADPPYATPSPYELFAELYARGAAAPGAIVVYEHAAIPEPPVPPAELTAYRQERWGEVGMTFLTRSRIAPAT